MQFAGSESALTLPCPTPTPHRVGFATDRSKAVVPMLFFFCGFVAYTTGRFMFSLALIFVLVFFQSFSIVITSLGEDRAGLCVSRAFVGFSCTRYFVSIFSSSSLVFFVFFYIYISSANMSSYPRDYPWY